MTWLSNLFSGGASSILDSTTDLVKSVYTSPGEKLSQEEALQRVQNVIIQNQQKVDVSQIKSLSKKEPLWRSAFAWVCVLGIFYANIARPFLVVYASPIFPEINISELIALISGMLGMSTLYLTDKLKSKN